MTDAALPEICSRVFEALIEGGEPKAGDLVEHVGSCMRCFRLMTELRDAPRLASALRAESAPLPEDDAFWDRLARRTVDAAAGALAGTGPAEAAAASAILAGEPVEAVGERPRVATPAARSGPAARSRRLGALTFAVVSAAAVALLLLAPGRQLGRAPAGTAASASAAGAPMSFGDEPWAAADVGDLDRPALRRLLDRLGAGGPPALAESAADGSDVPEALLDDDTRINDELADLDGPALLRVAQSFGRSRL